MAIYKEDFVEIDLAQGRIFRSFMNHSIGSGDDMADRFGVRVFRDGEPVNIGGNCAGYFVRNTTSETVVIDDGVVSGNEAYVTLPEACYAVEGSFSLAIKVSTDDETATLRIVDGVVDRTNTSEIVDPGDLIPSIEDLLDAIEAAVASIPADYSDLWESLAPNFSTGKYYFPGQYVTYDGTVYRFKKPHTFGGSWDSTEVDAVSLGMDVANLLYNITEYNPDNLWTIGDWDIPANPGYRVVTEWSKPLVLPAGTYTFSGMITSEDTEANVVRMRFAVGESSQYVNLDANTGKRTSKTVTFASEASLYRLQSSITVSDSLNHAATFRDMQIVVESSAGDYFPALTAKDYRARQNNALLSLCDKQNEVGIWGGDLLDAERIHALNVDNSGLYEYVFAKLYPAGVYTVIYNISSSDSNVPTLRFSSATDHYANIASAMQYIEIGKTVSLTFNIEQPWGQVWLFAGNTVSDSAGRTLTINRLDIYKGTYLDHDNGVDVTKSIEATLAISGVCELGKGVYTVDGVRMPSGSQIRGATGSVLELTSTALSTVSLPELTGDTFNSWVTTSYNLAPGTYEFTINMESTYTGATTSRVCFCSEENYNSANVLAECLVSRGADYTYLVTVDSQIKSIFVFGGRNTQTPCTFTVHKMDITKRAGAVLPELAGTTWGRYVTTAYNLSPGMYTFTINMESTYTGATTSRICFCSEETYGSIIVEQLVERGADYTYSIYVDKQIKSIFVFGGRNTQTECTFTVHKLNIMQSGHSAIIMNGDDCTVQDVTIRGSATEITPSETPGTQIGIIWCNPDIRHGTITRCNFKDFDNSGILAFGTGYPTDHGLIISDCFITNNCIGINIKYNCEFNKISNCIVSGNYYGVINRGGNNIVDSCGIDSNVFGMLVNEDEGGNNGHGSISNCTFNHSNNNEGYGLIIKDTGRMLVENCNVYYSKIRLENTNGNVLSNCGFGSAAPIEIVGGACSMIVNCMVRTVEDTPITLQNNDRAKVINCYTRMGGAVTPTTV